MSELIIVINAMCISLLVVFIAFSIKALIQLLQHRRQVACAREQLLNDRSVFDPSLSPIDQAYALKHFLDDAEKGRQSA